MADVFLRLAIYLVSGSCNVIVELLTISNECWMINRAVKCEIQEILNINCKFLTKD